MNGVVSIVVQRSHSESAAYNLRQGLSMLAHEYRVSQHVHDDALESSELFH